MKWAVLVITALTFTACGGKESVYASASAARSADKPAIAPTPSEYGGGTTAQVSDKSAAPAAPSSGVSSGPVSYQEFQKFRVEVEDVQIREDGSVLLGFGYVNKTNSAFEMHLDRDATLLSDDVGNSYKLEKELGTFTRIEPGRGSVALIFAVEKKRDAKPRRFNFISKQFINCCEPYNIVIRGIEAK